MAPIHLMLLMVALFQTTTVTADCITDGTKPVFAFIVSRHGDRAPINESLSTIKIGLDMKLIGKKVAKYGYGQLTEKGKMRSYQLGKCLRSRYDGLLSKTYKPSEIYVRASNLTRLRESLKLNLAGLFPAQSSVHNYTVIRQPVPERIINATFLPLLFRGTCQKFRIYQNNSLYIRHSSLLAQYSSLLKKLTRLTGNNATERPLLTYDMYDAYLTLQNIGYKLKPEIRDLLPELRKACADATDIQMGQQELLPLESGVLLNDFLNTATRICNGTSKEKMRLYSGQDFNVYALQLVSQVEQTQGRPDYSCFFALELRRVIETGKLVVLLVYLPDPDKPVKYLRVRGCGGYLCDLDTFKGITKGYSITQQEFQRRCRVDSC